MNEEAAINGTAYQILDRAHPEFAGTPIGEACNWSEFASRTNLEQWYMVAFRSTRKPTADGPKLEQLGEVARQDASRQPGYLFYFKGNLPAGSTELRNLSFCMWRSRSDAEAAAQRESHQDAIKGGIGMYQEYIVERYHARIHRTGQRARVEFERIGN